MNKKTTLALLLILALALFLRVWNVSSPIYGDENPWPYAAADHSMGGFNFAIARPYDTFVWTSPPLAPLLYRFFTWPLGVSEVTLRLLPLLLGLLNIYLTFCLARRLFDEKTALLAAGIMAVSFWHVLSSFLIEHDSSIMMTFWLLFFNAFVLHEQTGKRSWLWWAGLAVVGAMLTKLTGILMVAVLAVHLFVKWIMKGHHPRELLKPALLCLALCVLALIPVLITYLISPAYLAETFTHTGVMTLVPSAFNALRILIYLALWATPLLAGTAILSVVAHDPARRDSYALLWTWCALVLAFYFFTKYIAAIDRYLAILIPALAILAAATIRMLLPKSSSRKTIGLAILALGVLIFLNLAPSFYIAHDIGGYLMRALTLQWDFLFPFTGGTGPAFMTSFLPLAVGLVACAIASVAVAVQALRARKPRKGKAARAQRTTHAATGAMMVFLAFALGLNLFIVQAFILKAPYPDVGQVTRTMAADIDSAFPNTPLYATDVDLAWYTNRTSAFYPIGDFYTSTPAQAALIEKNISVAGGVVAITDFPKHADSDPIWRITKDAGCLPVRTYGPSAITIAYLYYCPAASWHAQAAAAPGVITTINP